MAEVIGPMGKAKCGVADGKKRTSPSFSSAPQHRVSAGRGGASGSGNYGLSLHVSHQLDCARGGPSSTMAPNGYTHQAFRPSSCIATDTIPSQNWRW